MAVNPRSSLLVAFASIALRGSGLFGADPTLERVEELLMAPEPARSQSRLVTTVFGSMDDSQLADIIVSSASLSLRLRAAEEIALHRGDPHACETLRKLMEDVLDLPLPYRVDDAILSGNFRPQGPGLPAPEPTRIRVHQGIIPTEVKRDEWSVSFEAAGRLVVSTGRNRREVQTSFQRPNVAAVESDGGIIVCALYDASGDSPPLCLAFEKATADEIWRHECVVPSRDQFVALRNDLELAIHGDHVYVFGTCSLRVFVECLDLSNGSHLGSYRLRSPMMPLPKRHLVPAERG
ncbi:hypothetical protein VT03_15135 [Planctomyces sp. SH-PL14]|nr:hypothetical protein VT03_15135 [Planctomyces sp. SH-PL14]